MYQLHGKLYEKTLFEDIKFPKGKVYEDTAIMYKLFEKAKILSFGNKKCYYYIARCDSISKSKGFNKKEEDYIENTNQMLKYIKNKYPELEKAVNRFYVYANFRILRMLIFTKPRNKKMEKEISKEIKKYKKDVFKDKKTPKRDKIAILTLNFGLPIFKITWNMYCIITGRI